MLHIPTIKMFVSLLIVTVLAITSYGEVSNSCPPHSTDYIPHPTNFGKFLQCVNGTAREVPCPEGFLYNSKNNFCYDPADLKTAVESIRTKGLSRYYDCPGGYGCPPPQPSCPGGPHCPPPQPICPGGPGCPPPQPICPGSPGCPPPQPICPGGPQCPPPQPTCPGGPGCPPPQPSCPGGPHCPPPQPICPGGPGCPPPQPICPGSPGCPPPQPICPGGPQCPPPQPICPGSPGCPPPQPICPGGPQCPPPQPSCPGHPSCPTHPLYPFYPQHPDYSQCPGYPGYPGYGYPVGTCPFCNGMCEVDMLPDAKDCTVFYMCDWGCPIWKRCPAGLHFNTMLKVCDYPWKAGCANTGKPPCQ